MSEYDINYYLTEKPPELWTAAVLMAVILMTMTFLLVRKLLGWSLALPLVLFANVSPARSFDESTRITKGNRTQVLALLVSWGIHAILLTGIVFGVIQLAGSWLIPSFIGSISILVLLLGGLSLTWMLGNFLLTTFTSGVFAYLVMGLYEEHALPWI